MRLHRDGVGTVWVVRDNGREVRLKDLASDHRADLLDELVHDAVSQAAAKINNAGEEAQVAYLLGDDPAAEPLVHVMEVETKHDRTLTVNWSDEDARAALASFVDQAWASVFADEPMPADPDAAIERYFSRAPDDSYFLDSTTISHPAPS